MSCLCRAIRIARAKKGKSDPSERPIRDPEERPPRLGEVCKLDTLSRPIPINKIAKKPASASQRAASPAPAASVGPSPLSALCAFWGGPYAGRVGLKRQGNRVMPARFAAISEALTRRAANLRLDKLTRNDLHAALLLGG